jgi:hypothetical protein
MADVQKQFEQFHATIRVDYEMGANLREKRDIIVAKIERYLEQHGHPSCRVLLQGSYKMKTGVKPIAELEYDLDIGLRFDLDESAHSAAEVRGWVLEAVRGHTQNVEDKGPCIRVNYEAGFHLDLVVFAVSEEDNGTERYRLAHRTKGWRPADPPGLLEYVSDYHTTRFAGTEDAATRMDQFRRCVRCLRRWNDVQMPFDNDGKPTGLGLVLLAIQQELKRAIYLDGRSDDRGALAEFTRRIATTIGRVGATKPTPEFEDMFGRLTEQDMADFKGRMAKLADALVFAGATPDPVEACRRLQSVFGQDFPVPEPVDTARRTHAPAIVTPVASA